MYKAKITLNFLSKLDSVGANNNLEFRVPEIKALLRLTFKELFDYRNKNLVQLLLNKSENNIKKEDYDDCTKKIFGILFGSTSLAAKVKIRFERINKSYKKNGSTDYKKKKIVVKSKDKVVIVFLSKDRDYLKFYINLLKLGSVISGIGKGSRFKNGSFYVEDLEISRYTQEENLYKALYKENHKNDKSYEGGCNKEEFKFFQKRILKNNDILGVLTKNSNKNKYCKKELFNINYKQKSENEINLNFEIKKFIKTKRDYYNKKYLKNNIKKISDYIKNDEFFELKDTNDVKTNNSGIEKMESFFIFKNEDKLEKKLDAELKVIKKNTNCRITLFKIKNDEYTLIRFMNTIYVNKKRG